MEAENIITSKRDREAIEQESTKKTEIPLVPPTSLRAQSISGVD
jgi:hypothetical protein